MSCMKCGRDLVAEQAFCEDCLAEMERYPVGPNTPVVLPKRVEAPQIRKAPRKKTIPLETQILALKHRVRLLSILLAAVSILAALLMYPAVKYMMEDHFLPGQNYTSIVSKTSTTEPTAGD